MVPSIVLTAGILCCVGSQVKMSGDIPLNINIKEPRWDQGTFMGRAQHFFMVTDPRNVLLSSAVLEDARDIVENYRSVWQRGETCHKANLTSPDFLFFGGLKTLKIAKGLGIRKGF